jgi:hypothetical protein
MRRANASRLRTPQNQTLGAPPPPPPPLGAGEELLVVTVSVAALLVTVPTMFLTVTV